MNRSRAGTVAVRFLLLVTAGAVLSSCVSTRNSLFLEIDESAEEGNYETAVTSLEDESDTLYGKRDGVLYYLDSGMLHFYNRDYRTSIERFQEAERLIEEYFTRSVSQAATSLLLNDNQIDYAGEDFEDIYLNVFNAVAFMQQEDYDAAFVEVRRMNNKLNLLEDKYQGLAARYNQSDDAEVEMEPGESRFYNSAFGRYLSLIMYRGDGDYDGARIDWEQLETAFREQSNIYAHPNPFERDIIEPSDQARLSVLAFTGQAPIKRAVTLYVVTFNNRVDILYAEEGQEGDLIPEGYTSFGFPVEGGYQFKFQLPRMVLRGSDVERIRVVADGTPIGELGLLENMEQVALDTFQIKEPIIFLKTVTRTIVKGVLAQKGKEQMQQAGQESGSMLGLAAGLVGSVATGVAVDASEQADLRVSRYFPAYAYAGEWELEPGTYDIAIEYYGTGGLMYVEEVGPVEVDREGLNVVSSFYNN
ncbi:MAG: hypothetical protein ACLFSV_03250 [Alkalispirochaeta sp.]